MILDLNKEADQRKANVYLAKLVKQGAAVELKKINKRRTLSQNSYLHALFAIFGMEYGYDIEEAKIVVKRALKYTYKKNGRVFLEQTSKMDTLRLSHFIDKFRTLSAHHGCYLPTAEEFEKEYVTIMKQIEYAQ